MDHLDALRLFVRVADLSTISRAARELGIDQPAASRALAALEARWNARLFHRTTRKLTPTEAGLRAYERAVVVLAEADALEAAVRSADRQPAGLLRLSASVAFARAELGPRVGAFLAAYPQVKLDILARDERVDLVGDAVDLAFRLGALPDSGLTATRLGAYPRVLAAAPGLLARLGIPERPEDLGDLPTVGFSSTAFGGRWPLISAGRRIDIETTSKVRASTGELVRDMAVQGEGVAFLPSFLISDDITSGRLVRVLPQWSGPLVDLHAVWAARTLPRKARVYLDFIAPQLACER